MIYWIKMVLIAKAIKHQNLGRSHKQVETQMRIFSRFEWLHMEAERTTNHTSLGSLFLCCGSTEPAHEIMALFVLRKRILQMPMCCHPVGLDVWILVGPFVYFHTSCVWTAKALERLRRLAWAFAGCLCDKYHNLMGWLNYWFSAAHGLTLLFLIWVTTWQNQHDVRPAKTQISLGNCSVWLVFARCYMGS